MEWTRGLSHFLPMAVMLAAALGMSGSAALQGPDAANPQPEWSVEGEWTDTCSCQIPCPCWKEKMPTLGHCSEMLYFHVTKGHYGKVKLDGIDVVQVASSAQGKTTAQSLHDKDYQISNLYVQNTLSPEQVAAVEVIFTRLGYSGDIGRKHATKRVPLRAKRGADYTDVEIPGVLHAVVRMQKDANGKSKPFPFTKAANPALGQGIQGESVAFEFHDDGFSWKYSGRQGILAHFAYSSDRGPLP